MPESGDPFAPDADGTEDDLAHAIVAQASADAGTSPASAAETRVASEGLNRRLSAIVAIAAVLTVAVPVFVLSMLVSMTSSCVRSPGSGSEVGVKSWDWTSLSYGCTFQGGSTRNEGPGWWAALALAVIVGSIWAIVKLFTRRPVRQSNRAGDQGPAASGI